SILRKLIGYGATHRAGLHTAMYGLPNFRVLTEAPGRQRAANMITDGYQRHLSHTYPPGLFLFTDRRALFAAEDFLNHEWLDGEGKRHRLIDGAVSLPRAGISRMDMREMSRRNWIPNELEYHDDQKLIRNG